MEDPGKGGVGDEARRRVRATMAKDREEAATSGPRVVQSRIPRCAGPRSKGPRDPQAAAHYAQAVAALAAGELEAAEEALRRSLSRDDGALEAWRELAMVLVELGRYDEAAKPLEKVLDQDGFDFELVRFRAIAHDRSGRVEEALEDYRSFLTLAPSEHSKPRTHASMRIEQLVRGDVGGPGDGGSLVEELPPETPPAVRPGLVVLLVLAWVWVLWGEFTEAPPPPRPEGRLTVAYVKALAERADDAGLDQLTKLVIDGHSEAVRPPIEAAMEALVARGGAGEVDTLVTALAVVMRRSALRTWERAHKDAVVASLGKLDPALVAQVLEAEIASRGKAESEVDRRVQRELEAQRDRFLAAARP